MKRNMRVTSPRVGDPNPQTAGWFDPQADIDQTPSSCTDAAEERLSRVRPAFLAVSVESGPAVTASVTPVSVLAPRPICGWSA